MRCSRGPVFFQIRRKKFRVFRYALRGRIMSNTDKKYVTSKDIAYMFNFESVRRVQQLTQDGIIDTCEVKESGRRVKRYELYSTVKEYVKFLQDKAYSRNTKESNEELLRRKMQADVDYKEAKAQMANLQLDELEGRVHAAEDVESMTTDLCLAIRSALLAMPGQLSKDVADESDPAKIQIIIKDAVCLVLEELSRYTYNKENYKKRVADRQGWQQVVSQGEDTEEED